MFGSRRRKRRFQYCFDNLGKILDLRSLHGHSGSNLIDPTLKDIVLIRPGISPYIYHVGCNFNLYSINGNGLTPGGQNLSRRQPVFFSLVDPRHESLRNHEHIDFSVPRLARHVHSAWKTIRKGLKFYQTRSNAIIFHGKLPHQEMINRVLQLNINQLENSFNSLVEKHFMLDLPSQPHPNPIQLVIERG